MLPGLAELVVLEMLTEVRPCRAWFSCTIACTTMHVIHAENMGGRAWLRACAPAAC